MGSDGIPGCVRPRGSDRQPYTHVLEMDQERHEFWRSREDRFEFTRLLRVHMDERDRMVEHCRPFIRVVTGASSDLLSDPIFCKCRTSA